MSLLNKRVRLVGLTNQDLNGLQGVVSQHTPESGRYTVLMDDGSRKSLQSKNLEIVGSPRGGHQKNMAGGPQMQEMLQHALSFLQPVLQLLPTLQGTQGLTMLALFAILVWKIGISIHLLFDLIFVRDDAWMCCWRGDVFGICERPTLLQRSRRWGAGTTGNGSRLRFVPKKNREERERTRRMRGWLSKGSALAGQVSRAISYRFIVSPTMGTALLALLALLLVQFAMAGVDPSGGPSFVASPEEDAYAAGFRDASQGLEFGTSKPSPSASSKAAAAVSSSGGFGFGSMITLFILGKTVFDLGRTEAGWDPRQALERAKCMPRAQQVFFVFMLMRLAGVSPI